MCQAVIFDLDGTLLDSYKYGLKHLSLLAERNGLAPAARQKVLETWGHTGIEFLQNIFDIGRERAERLYREWEAIDLEDPIPLVEGAHGVLKWLHERKYVACMLTSRHRKSVLSILAREQLQSYFARITAREDSDYFKPDRRAFIGILQTLARQGVSREECLFVGDTLVDIEAGRNANVRTIVVETGPYRHEHHKTHPMPEDHVIASVKDLPAWLSAAG